jgi:hypothetical protein
VTEGEAIAIARATAEQEGWAWVEPALATFREPWFGKGGKWEIFSNALGLGAKARVVTLYSTSLTPRNHSRSRATSTGRGRYLETAGKLAR